MQNCSQCGASLGKNAKYCAVCLTPVNQQFSFTTLPDPVKKRAEILEAAKSANQEFLNPQQNHQGPRVVTAIPAQEIIRSPQSQQQSSQQQSSQQQSSQQQSSQQQSFPPFPNLFSAQATTPPNLPNSTVFPNQSKFESQANFPNQPLFNKAPITTPKIQEQLNQTIQLTQQPYTTFVQAQKTQEITSNLRNNQPITQPINQPTTHSQEQTEFEHQPERPRQQHSRIIKEPRVQQAPYIPTKNSKKPKPLNMDQEGFILVGSAHSDEVPIERITDAQDQSLLFQQRKIQVKDKNIVSPIDPIYVKLFQKEVNLKIFLFSFQHIQHRSHHEQPLLELARKLIKLLEERELLSLNMEEADLFISFETPSQSWIDALAEYKKSIDHLLIWYTDINAPQAQQQRDDLHIFFGEYGLLEIFKLIHFIELLDIQNLSKSGFEIKWCDELDYFTKINHLNYFISQLNQVHFEQKYLNQSMTMIERISKTQSHKSWFELCAKFSLLAKLFENDQINFDDIYEKIDEIKYIEALNRIKKQAQSLQNPQKTAIFSSQAISMDLTRLLDACVIEIKKYTQPKNLLQGLLLESFDILLFLEKKENQLHLELIKEIQKKYPNLKIIIATPLLNYHSFALTAHHFLDIQLPREQFAFQFAKAVLKNKENTPFTILGKYIDMVQIAQRQHQQKIEYALVILSFSQPITAVILEIIDRLKQQYIPKSLSAIKLDELHLSLICTELSEESFDLFFQALGQYFKPEPTVVAILSHESRQSAFLISDAFLRLELLKQNQQKKHYCVYGLAHFNGLISPRENTLDLVDTFATQIYIVDQQQSSFYALKQACESEGFIVSVGEFASDLIALLPQLTYIPQVFLIDCEDQKAFELLTLIKTHYPMIKVMMTAQNQIQKYMKESFDLGADDFIAKPFVLFEAIHRIYKVLYTKK